MSLEVAVSAHTKNQITSVNNRVYGVKGPVGIAKPYIVFNVVSGNFIHSMGGDSGLTESIVQFSVFGDEYGAVKGVAEDLKKAYRNYTKGDGTLMGSEQWVQSTLLTNEVDMYEDDTNLYHTALDITFWHVEVD